MFRYAIDDVVREGIATTTYVKLLYQRLQRHDQIIITYDRQSYEAIKK